MIVILQTPPRILMNADFCTELIDRSMLVHACVCVCVDKIVTLCAALWPVVIWRSELMWSSPAGVDFASSA